MEKMLDAEKIEDFNKRIREAKKEQFQGIMCFPEVKLTVEQIETIGSRHFDFERGGLLEYYKGKIDGEILLSSSRFTTREDQPDFQYLIDLGVDSLKRANNDKSDLVTLNIDDCKHDVPQEVFEKYMILSNQLIRARQEIGRLRIDELLNEERIKTFIHGRDE